MRRAVLLVAAGVLLLSPTVLAFFSGGYFDEPRLIATLVVWTLVLVAAVVSPQPLPVSRPGRVALAGLVLLAVWTGISLAWAPLGGPAIDNLARLLLYVGAFVAAASLLRGRVAEAVIEPALAFGAFVVIAYGLAGRLLPGLIELARSFNTGGRLEQPITYWNSEGLLAAMGFVLCARLAGTEFRPAAVRIAAAAASAPLGLGVYLTYSRGAIVAAVGGLIVLLAAAPTRSQARAVGAAVVAGVIAAGTTPPFPGVASLEGSPGRRQSEGVAMLGILLVIMLAAGAWQARNSRAERREGAAVQRLGIAGSLPAVAAVAVLLAVAGLVVGGLGEQASGADAAEPQGAARLASVGSRRQEYWRVGLLAVAEHPLRGVGAGGFRVIWRRERPVRERVLEVHSLPLEMAAELGAPGLLGLCLFVGGVAAAGGRALRRRPPLAAGACAATTAWLVHATVDWHWQIPAVTLPALLLAGALVVAGEADPERPASTDQPPDRGAPGKPSGSSRLNSAAA